MTPFKAIKIIIHVISTDHQLLLELMLYGSHDHGLDINVQVLKAVHTFIVATKCFL